MESTNKNGIHGDQEVAMAELIRGHGHLWNIIFSYVNSMALKCAAELGIADVIHRHDQPLPMSVLLTKLSIPLSRADSFRRLMRLLVHSGLFASSTASDEKEEAYALTPISASFLVTSKAENMSPFVLTILDPVLVDPWHCLSRWFTSAAEPPAAFDLFHGKSLFELTGNNPEFNVNFNRGMAADASFMAKLILKQYGDDVFLGLRSLVDVGGGTGFLATAIADAFPQTKCAVFDLPHVVSSLQGNPTVAAIAGNMFEFVPPADAVILKWILHDWNDEDCVRILRNCKKAIPPKEEGGKVIIIEMVTTLENEEDVSIHDETTETQLLFDVFVRAAVPGKERSEAEWKSIFMAAGFSDYSISPISGSRSLIQLFY
ncbi:trans-resveratrol di-O-methyltransferase-like [Zingiber officinale]|uniref:trans-resveratrol di-O-methyltransferase-like n=1 Tax=Zingiber officinale TaxID=94328 RepID=UPI001C4BE146|nr:trans-resveratrol di-O-methyltransferase-like [Zingiber officinale]